MLKMSSSKFRRLISFSKASYPNIMNVMLLYIILSCYVMMLRSRTIIQALYLLKMQCGGDNPERRKLISVSLRIQSVSIDDRNVTVKRIESVKFPCAGKTDAIRTIRTILSDHLTYKRVSCVHQSCMRQSPIDILRHKEQQDTYMSIVIY